MVAAAAATTFAAPVTVQTCRVAATGNEFDSWDDYEIVFTNRADRAVTGIWWRIYWAGGSRSVVESRGRFAAGSSIRQRLRDDSNAEIVLPFWSRSTPVYCYAESVRFEDGNRWNNTAAPPSAFPNKRPRPAPSVAMEHRG